MSEASRQIEERRLDDSRFALAQAWRDAIQLLMLVVAFLGGIFLRPALSGDSWPVHWNYVFVALGTLCLGFGAGILVYRIRQRSEAAQLRNDYAEMRKRAQAAAAEMDRLQMKK
jgi:hypothetical protein